SGAAQLPWNRPDEELPRGDSGVGGIQCFHDLISVARLVLARSHPTCKPNLNVQLLDCRREQGSKFAELQGVTQVASNLALQIRPCATGVHATALNIVNKTKNPSLYWNRALTITFFPFRELINSQRDIGVSLS